MSAVEGFWLGLKMGALWGILATLYVLSKFGFFS